MSIKDKIKEKLNDDTLYTGLKNFASAYKQSKENAYKNHDFNALQKEMNTLKALDTEKIKTLFAQFKHEASKAGAFVYEAATGEDACRYIAEVCKKHGSEYTVKSKSMTSEEIRLNDYLEKENIKPIETDLGEWILQLAGEHPSHMVMPAIHKTRGQVSELFEKYTGKEVSREDIKEMVQVAREELREFYFKAKVGITGANLAVAETGTTATVTNEGNARLTTTEPPVHIVLLGYEKLIPDFKTALKLIRMLPKSATGQIITSYITWVKGQNPSHNSETGKKEIHYVFLDNGRLNLLDHPVLSEALKCMRCGSCANICPAYEMVGGHVFGHIYIGAIGLIMTAMFHGEDKAKELMGLCIGCRACSANCPSGIDLQKIISELHVYLGSKYGIGKLKKFVYSSLLSNEKLFRTAMKIGSLVEAPLVKNGKLEKIPIVGREINFRQLPAISSKTFTDRLAKMKINGKRDKGRVFFYPGCAVEYFYPEMGIAIVQLLENEGYLVDTPYSAACCGLPAIHGGDGEGGRKTIERNLDFMKNPDDYEAYLTLCPSCGLAIKDDFVHYTEKNKSKNELAKAISPKVRSLGMFLKEKEIRLNIDNTEKVTYHVPCHLGRGLGGNGEDILSELLGDNFVKMTDSNVCCGFGGSWSFDYPGISSGILNKKISNIEATKADIVLTECPGCVMQIEGGISKQNKNVKVEHLSNFLMRLTKTE